MNTFLFIFTTIISMFVVLFAIHTFYNTYKNYKIKKLNVKLENLKNKIKKLNVKLENLKNKIKKLNVKLENLKNKSNTKNNLK